MNQKTAIVTGGASGLGLAIAKKFITNSIKTFIIGRDLDKLKEAAIELGPDCIPVQFDLTEFEKIPGFVSRLTKTFNGIDILVNNAGIHLKKPMQQVTDEEFQRVITTNLNSIFSLSREVSHTMITQGKGSIINISSMAAQYGIPQVVAYSAAKAGIEGMTKAMAVELSPLGIRVNCIAPGFIKTNMSSAALDKDPKRKERVLARTPLAKLGQAGDVADAAYFLASEQANFITGTILNVDGGNAIGF